MLVLQKISGKHCPSQGPLSPALPPPSCTWSSAGQPVSRSAGQPVSRSANSQQPTANSRSAVGLTAVGIVGYVGYLFSTGTGCCRCWLCWLSIFNSPHDPQHTVDARQRRESVGSVLATGCHIVGYRFLAPFPSENAGCGLCWLSKSAGSHIPITFLINITYQGY